MTNSKARTDYSVAVVIIVLSVFLAILVFRGASQQKDVPFDLAASARIVVDSLHNAGVNTVLVLDKGSCKSLYRPALNMVHWYRGTDIAVLVSRDTSPFLRKTPATSFVQVIYHDKPMVVGDPVVLGGEVYVSEVDSLTGSINARFLQTEWGLREILNYHSLIEGEL